MPEEFKPRKFDIRTNEGSVIHGVIYTEKPSFNYTEQLTNKTPEDLRKLKVLRDTICTSLRINKIDMVVDIKKFRLLTSRRIVVRYQNDIKKMNLIPAIAEDTADLESIEVQVEYL